MQGKTDGEENARLGGKKIQGGQKKLNGKKKKKGKRKGKIQRKIIQIALEIKNFPKEQ